MMNAFNKTLLVSALTAASLASAQAAEPLTVYGKLNVTVQSNDEAGDSETVVQSNASRLGVKGAFELSSSLEAFYTIEYEVDAGSDAKENFLARNQFVGLKGNFGALSVGRNDTMLKIAQGKVDQFNDLSGDLKSLFKGENRIEQTVTYLSPEFGGFKVGATYAAEGAKSQAGEDGFSLAAMYGDSSLKKTAFYASVAYDSEVKGYDILRATVQAKLAGLVLGGMYQQEEKSVDGDSKTGYLVSAAYNIADVTLKGQFQDMEDKGDSWSIGADYKLGKPTKIFAFYTSRDMESADDTDNYIGVGIEHKF
ncbi:MULTISPECIES: porin [Shewanella]|uniref:porin n=1 Tax=Shewanella TaxID=22 RepID=UPI001C656881|nr:MULTISPECIES: porin [Shewanella]QYJ76422.1 porin [Shewanella sp. FJAT-52076]QYK06338.1 porin [Shewanella zhangzhouensis]